MAPPPRPSDPAQTRAIEAAIAALEAQRAVLGDAVTDTALAGLRDRLAALTAGSGEAGQSLRLVTVLFLDVVGSTTLSQFLDPEDIHAVMDGALARCTAIVEAHQGKVLQYAGDNLLAVFGADASQEDDADRALLAGLALLDEGRAQGDLVWRRHGHHGFNVRVGIHTGNVLLGGGVDAEGSIRGITVNIAARMEQTAPAGGLRISLGTRRQVRGAFELELQPPIAVKGVDEPIVTFLVHRARPSSLRVGNRGVDGVDTRMIGREAELARLQDAFAQAGRQGRLVALSVVGDAGVGKSRLLHEFREWLATQPGEPRPFQARAHPATRGQSYGLLRDLLTWRAGITDSDGVDAAARRFEQFAAALLGADTAAESAQGQAHLLGHLIGLDFGRSPHLQAIRDDGAQIRRRALQALARLFRQVAAATDVPVVLLLDDLHWADDGSLDAIEQLVHADHDGPMLVLGLMRPTLFDRRAQGPAGPAAERIDLAPLDEASSRRLADELLQRLPEVPETLRALIAGRAEGNPFYMEELLKMLVDEGAIAIADEGWTLRPERLLAMPVPPTLTGVLQARLDSLRPAEKLALQQASVVGFRFWDQALGAIDAQAVAVLPRLSRLAMVKPRPDSSFEGARELAFDHQLLHQVTYGTVLKRIRRHLHAAVGGWLADQAGARAHDFLGLAAEHFGRAGDVARACAFYARAAEHAGARHAHGTVIDHVTDALALIDAQGADPGAGSPEWLRRRWQLLDLRERALGLQGRRAAQRQDIDALQEVAEALADDALRAEVAWRRCDIALRTADYRAMEGHARQSESIAARIGDDLMRLRAQQRLAIAVGELGDPAAALALAQQGLAGARTLGQRRLESLYLTVASAMASTLGDLMAALELDRQKVALDRELGNPLNLAISEGNFGEGWLQLGQHENALMHLQEGLRLTRLAGDKAMQCTHLLNLSQLLARHGDAAAALDHAQAALAIGTEVQNPETMARALWSTGQAELGLGRAAAAAEDFERAGQIAAAEDLPTTVLDALAGGARAALARGEADAAMPAVARILATLADGGTLAGTDAPRLIALTCHRVLAQVGDPRATAVLDDAHADLQAVAARITDPGLRDSFLGRIPEHREIVALWQAGRT